jgi:hypothetical protein
MITHESHTWDRVFVALLVVSVIATLLGMRVYANHLKAEKASMSTPKTSRQAPKNVLHLEAITNVHECERDGQRVLTDRPCGSGVPIRVLGDAKEEVE